MDSGFKKHLEGLGVFKMDGSGCSSTYGQEKARYFGHGGGKTLEERDSEREDKQKRDIVSKLKSARGNLDAVAERLRREYPLLGYFIKSERDKAYSENRFSTEPTGQAASLHPDAIIVKELGAAVDLFATANDLLATYPLYKDTITTTVDILHEAESTKALREVERNG